MLLVLGARDTELTDAGAATLAELRREGPVTGVALTGLDDDGVAAVVARITGGADPEAVQGYRRWTGGNPFFLDEVLRDERERGAVAAEPSPSVREVVGRRLRRLGDAAGGLLPLAAVAGQEFDLHTVATVGGQAPAQALEALDGALATGLVVEGAGPGRFAWAHALVADTLVASLPASRRARLHAQLAEHLAAEHAAGRVGAGEVVRHLRAAAPLTAPELLRSWELAAAREASAALAHADAAGHLEAALVAAPDAADRAELLLALGDARDRAGRREPAREAFREAAGIARAQGDASLLARAGLGFGGLAVVIGRPEPGSSACSRRRSGRCRRPSAHLGPPARALAVELYYADQDRSRELSARALADARSARDPATLAAALNARRVALWDPRDILERLEAVDEMIAVAQAADLREAVLQGRNWRVCDLWELGRMDEVRAEIAAYEGWPSASGCRTTPGGSGCGARAWRGWQGPGGGRGPGRAGARARGPGGRSRTRRCSCASSARWCASCATSRSTSRSSRTWRSARRSRAPTSARWRSSTPRAAGTTVRASACSRLIADDCALVPANANWIALCELAEAAAETGHLEGAEAAYAKLEPLADLIPVIGRGLGCYPHAHFFLGRSASALGRLHEAEARLRRALEAGRAAGAHARTPMTLLRLGEVLQARGDRAGAVEMLGAAAAGASALGIRRLAERAERARARAGA
jgi:tetratricopeptide (TPR) repeat protein